ncbi:VOC family protein [Flavilitoribacter nigricans]|uniref:Glyoxalase/bleomycin resistance/extradiol dioxygenase family protein n=1 Tax=Flavilitoribacter nigricans (strain ATCC 23147 / DSM 23189 / NBRC 102662 / NCIMB 1420 / SS-2) TaxID=1122177 RepID=A0A2D0N3Z7_FLAN2|nr:glyoxalase/bleomycin resistance/extradiol dioxygenase family protein [Flavilitoribacter nigricans]PHN02483.1 glyoxalase/bleomycin resistance/extradiol dioxygenase family protein [Flavilitoribacter nigricans DSM 23189 = NBRC 102662]
MKLNLLVIRTEIPEKLKMQYELLGFQFEYHRHGNGPLHFAAEKDDFVFEIYPLARSMVKADASLRLGFTVEDLDGTLANVDGSDWKMVTGIKETEWGRLAVLQDTDGRKVELKKG